MQDCIALWSLWCAFLEDFMNKLNRHLSEGIKVKSEAKILDLNDLWAHCFSFFVVTGGGFLDPTHLRNLDA